MRLSILLNCPRDLVRRTIGGGSGLVSRFLSLGHLQDDSLGDAQSSCVADRQDRAMLDALDAVKAEARQRAANGSFFGHITYISLIAQKPV
jgi:hypothetical protein